MHNARRIMDTITDYIIYRARGYKARHSRYVDAREVALLCLDWLRDTAEAILDEVATCAADIYSAEIEDVPDEYFRDGHNPYKDRPNRRDRIVLLGADDRQHNER